MESTGFNIVLGGGQKLSGDMENSKYNIVLYDDQEYSGDSDFTAHEPPAYRSVYVADVQIDEATGHLIVTLSDGTTIDSGYVRGSQGVPGTPGTNGTNGKDGKDGHSPVVTAEKSGKITIIKVDGEQIATIADGTDGSINLTGATAGQIPKISAVDSNGKPTAWEPVDMPGGGSSETEVFICTITGSTSSGYSCNKTIDEINTAYLAGKLVYAKDDTRIMPLVGIAHPQIAQFCVALAGGGLVGYSITGSGTVTAISQQTQLKKLVTSISSSSTNTDYPSAKAVWNAIPHSLVVDIQIARLGELDSAPVVDKTFDEIYTAYTNGDYVHALVHCYGMTAHVGIAKISADSVTFGKCYPDSADTTQFQYVVCVDIMSDDTAEGYFREEHFLPKATSADNGKVLMVKNGYWDLGSVSGGSSAQKLIVTATVSGYNVYDGQPTVDKTLTEIEIAYDSGADVYAKVYVGSEYLCLAPCVFCSADHAMFSTVYADSPDTPDIVNYVSLYVFDGGCEAYVASSSMFVPRVTSADNGKALVVKNGAWSVENVSGGEKAWTKIIDADVTETTLTFKKDSLNGVTEFNIRWSNLQSTSTTDSGLCLMINGLAVSGIGSVGLVGKSGASLYGWTHINYDGLFWHITSSQGSTTLYSNARGSLYSVYNLAENVGAADDIELYAPNTQYAPVSGKLEVWAR